MPKRLLKRALVIGLFGALAGPALAIPVVYTATLSGAAESPPVASAGAGTARITIDDDTDTMRVEASFSGLTGTTTVAHIHCCTVAPGAGNVGVATFPGTFPGFPVGVTSGSYDFTIDMSLPGSYTAAFLAIGGGSAAGAFSALIAGLDSGRAYFNVHSTFAPGGEIRGFLATDRTAVPEPASLMLVLAGLIAAGAAGAAARRSRAG